MFRKSQRSALIYELQMEVDGHHHRLDRAAAGMSLAFVPTSGEHVQITKEQKHLGVLHRGTFRLGQVWSVGHPKVGKLNLRQRKRLLTTAIADVQTLMGQAGESAGDTAMWRDLHEYLVAKRSCSCTDEGQDHTWQYSTLGQDFGYALRACSPQRM